VVHDTQRGSTPYDVVSAGREVQVSTKRLLLPVSHSLEQRARAMSLPPILLAGFQQGRFFTPHTALRYARMAERLPLVCAFGTGMPATPATGVRGGDLSPDDPLRDEWTVIVLGAHFSAALVSRDLGDAGADADRRFSYVVTHDRALVTAAARTLIDRVART
jgi:DICT domain-containing protein